MVGERCLDEFLVVNPEGRDSLVQEQGWEVLHQMAVGRFDGAMNANPIKNMQCYSSSIGSSETFVHGNLININMRQSTDDVVFWIRVILAQGSIGSYVQKVAQNNKNASTEQIHQSSRLRDIGEVQIRGIYVRLAHGSK